MIESKIMHIAPRVAPISMPALAPVLSPELELGVDDRVGVKETLLVIRGRLTVRHFVVKSC